MHMKKKTHLSQTGQNQITGIVVGVIVSILSVIGIIVPTIFVRQRCVRKRNEQPQTGFGIRKLCSINVPKHSEYE